MKKMRKIKKETESRGISFVIVLLAGLALCNLCFDRICYRNYLDKMEILSRMIDIEYRDYPNEQEDLDEQGKLHEQDLYKQDSLNEQNRLDQALLLVREGGMQTAQLLEKYGYKNSLSNSYYALFLRQCIVFSVVSAILFAVCVSVFALRQKRWNQTNRAYLKMLGKSIAELRELGIHQEASGSQKKSAGAGRGFLKGCEAESDYLFDQLEMLEEALDAVRERAVAEKERTKGIVTDLAHQLKTPVAALDTCFAVLEDGALSGEERAEFYVRCRQELEGLKALLDALVQISHMESGMIQIVRKQALLLDTLLAAVNRIYPKASEKQIELVFDNAADVEELAVCHDARWMCEAFVNLLDNAVKYSPANSEIRIGIQRQVSFVRIEIADQGIGIARKEQHKVFQRFYRGADPRVQAQSGSGIGLYLARRIVGEHHGNVSVRTGREKKEGYPGSIFVVQIPGDI